MALILFLLAKAAMVSLPTAHFVPLRPLSSFSHAQYVQDYPLKPVPFCKLFAGLGSTNKSAISLIFSSSLTLALFSPPCPIVRHFFYLNLSSRSERNCLLSPRVLSGYNKSPDTRFSRETTRLKSWPDGEHYSCPLQSLVASLFLSLVFTFIFSRTGGVLFHLNSSTHRSPRFPLRNSCFLVTLAVCSLVFAATDTVYTLISVGLAESRIFYVEPADTCPRTPLNSFSTVQLRTLCAARSLAILYLFMTSGPDLEELSGIWGSMVFRHAPISRKGSSNNNKNNNNMIY